MQDYRKLINREAAKIDSLHKKIHETYLTRNSDRESWSNACKDFHEYVSEIDWYLDQIDSSQKIADLDLQEFAITFLELDPLFFRSGYIKAGLLKRLKRSDLGRGNQARLQGIVIDAVKHRPRREFREYCRLARSIKTDDFVYSLSLMASSASGALKSRAKLALQTINS
jgi:hypothetical protein